jgi:predicted acetylornithine/succinylornithine family transaminase
MVSTANKVNWQELEQRYYMRTFNRLPVVLVRGEGCRVWDDDDKSYLDLVAGIAVNALGHAHPDLVKAIADQAGQLIHTSNLYYSTPQLELAKLIAENSDGERVFFVNSGAEANETAIKLAQKYGKKYLNGANEIVTATGSFHGRTMATVAATGQEKFAKPYAGDRMPSGFKVVPFNDVAALAGAIGPRTCAVMVETVQGESGVHIATDEYMREIRRLCDETGALLILDEVQTGIGRTGKFMGYQHYDIKPDVFSLAKGLGGGVPIGAGVSTDKASVLEPGDHGSTFGGNALACAAGVATVRTILRDDLLGNATRMGERFVEKLNELKAKDQRIATVRGRGLMVAFDTTEEIAPKVMQEALKRGAILNATGPNTVRMVPPLIISAAEVDEAVKIIGDSLAAV